MKLIPASKAALTQAFACSAATPPEYVSHEPRLISETSMSLLPSLRRFISPGSLRDGWGARAAEPLELRGRELQLARGEQLGELRGRGGARDRCEHCGLGEQPRERHRGDARAVRRGDLIQGVEHGEAPLVEVALPHAGRARAVDPLTAAAVLAGEKAAREAEVGDAGEVVALAHGGQLALVLIALHQVVVRLQRHVARHAVAP